MSEDKGNQEPLLHGVRRRRERSHRWEREARTTLLGQLLAVGSLGWLIVVPPLIGVVLGRWIDRHLHTGIQATAALVVAGVAVGGWLAWRRMHGE